MSIAKSVKALEDSVAKSDDQVKKELTEQVQGLVEEACRKHKVAFFRYQDEWTFVDLEDPKPKDSNSEGKWHYAGFRGDHIDKKLPKGMRDDLLAIQKLIYTNRLQPESVPNGISAKLQENVLYRLKYMVSCP